MMTYVYHSKPMFQYLVNNVKEHPYVKYNTDCNRTIMATLSFMSDLNTINVQEEFFKTPKMAIPRIPHDVIFAIGGWSGGQARQYVEVYDTRADRWISLPNNDPHGPRAYHGIAVVDHKIYCIGGYDGSEHFNLCTVFDTVNKTWKEVLQSWFQCHRRFHPLRSYHCRLLQCTIADVM